MSKEEVIEKLKKLKQEDTELSWSAIERKIKMPKNNLVGMINGSRAMPEKWVKALSDFINNLDRPPATNVIELPADYVNVDKIGILTSDGKIVSIDESINEYLKSFEKSEHKYYKLWKMAFDGLKAVFVDSDKLTVKPTEVSKTEEKQKDKETAVQEKEVENKAEIEARIAFLEKELKSPPTNPSIGLKMWISIRQSEINNLKKQLIN